jgi:DNA-directed RNA polymerase specialized sigma24 family protein
MSQPSVRAATENPEGLFEKLVQEFEAATAKMDELEELLVALRNKRQAVVLAMRRMRQPYREIGRRLGLSTQRAHAIAKSSPRSRTQSCKAVAA